MNTKGKDIAFLIFTEKLNPALGNIYAQDLTYSRLRNNVPSISTRSHRF